MSRPDPDPRWDAPSPAPGPWPEQPAPPGQWPEPPPAPGRWPAQPPTNGPLGEQPTTQLPRPPGAGQYPYPYPPPVAPTPDSPTADGPRDRQPPEQRYQPSPRGSHLPPYREPFGSKAGPPAPGGAERTGRAEPAGTAADGSKPAGQPPRTGRTGPKKLTVTRVAAFRSRELTTKGVQIFHRAATADGADRSGLTSLTYAVMGNYAVDAALAVALANTLFFAAAKAESTGKVLLYLLITVAPFAVIAPLIGPALDRLQHGRRIALAASSFARAVLAIVMAVNFDSWVLYPCALGMLVLSKSFGVLKAAVTPRVLPPDITLVKTNSRLTVFGLMAGGVAGALAAGLSWAFGSTGALIFTAVLSVIGGWLCLRIPAWVESTEGEVPVDGVRARTRQAFPLTVTTTLWANGSIRVETGFLALFIAFVIKSEYADSSAFTQLLLLGVVGVAAGLGGFLGNAIGARMPLSRPDMVSIGSLGAVVLTTLIAALIPGLTTAAIVGLVGSTASSLAKVCLDSVIQHELPEASRASAFGVSETALQLSWVFGGVIGLLLGGVWTFGHDSVYTIGFAVVTVLLAVGLTQSWLVRRGRSLFPWLHYDKLAGRFRRDKDASTTVSTRLSTPVDPTTGPPVWGPPPAGFGQPPWSTGPSATGHQPPGYPPNQPATGAAGYGAGPTGWSPPAGPAPTSRLPGRDQPPPRPAPRDAGSPRRKTKDP